MCLIHLLWAGYSCLKNCCRLLDHGLIPRWYTKRVGRDHSVSITTRYGLDGLGNESRFYVDTVLIASLKYFIVCSTLFSSEFVQSWRWHIVGGEWYSVVRAAKNK